MACCSCTCAVNASTNSISPCLSSIRLTSPSSRRVADLSKRSRSSRCRNQVCLQTGPFLHRTHGADTTRVGCGARGRADPCGNTSANRKWSRSFRRKSQANRSCLQRGKAGFTSLSRKLRAFTGQWNTSACTTPARMFYRLGIDPVC